jgi:hypothetical protein
MQGTVPDERLPSDGRQASQGWYTGPHCALCRRPRRADPCCLLVLRRFNPPDGQHLTDLDRRDGADGAKQFRGPSVRR